MAALGSQSIASSYEQLLHVDADGGGNGTTHVSVKAGDNGTTFGFTIASDALMMSSTNRLEFGDTGTYIHQSADGVLDLVSDTEIEINATTIDMNGALDVSGATQLNSTLTVGVDDTGYDVKFFGATATNGYMLWDESTDDLILGSASKLGIGATSPNATLDVRGNIYSEGATGIEFLDTGTAPYNPLTFKAIRSGGSAIQADEDLLEITAQGYDGGAYREMAGLKFAVDGTPGSGDAPGRIEFWTTADSGTTFAEKMRIDDAGNVGIGTIIDDYTPTLGVQGAQPGLVLNDSNSDAFLVAYADGGSATLMYDHDGFLQIRHATSVGGGSAATTFKVDGSGNVTKPLQPAFSCKPSSALTDRSVNGWHTIFWQTEIFDVGSNFDNSTSGGTQAAIVAPVTGKYQLNVNLVLTDVPDDAAHIQLRITTSNRNYDQTFDPDFGQNAAYWNFSASVLADMDASDIAQVQIYVSGGSAELNITEDSRFSGFLAC